MITDAVATVREDILRTTVWDEFGNRLDVIRNRRAHKTLIIYHHKLYTSVSNLM